MILTRTKALNANGYAVVREIVPAQGQREWVDYIPVQEVAEVVASANRYEDDGHIVVTLS